VGFFSGLYIACQNSRWQSETVLQVWELALASIPFPNIQSQRRAEGRPGEVLAQSSDTDHRESNRFMAPLLFRCMLPQNNAYLQLVFRCFICTLCNETAGICEKSWSCVGCVCCGLFGEVCSDAFSMTGKGSWEWTKTKMSCLLNKVTTMTIWCVLQFLQLTLHYNYNLFNSKQ